MNDWNPSNWNWGFLAADGHRWFSNTTSDNSDICCGSDSGAVEKQENKYS